MDRIRQKDLEDLIDQVNVLTNNRLHSYSDGQWNIGTYFLYYAYGKTAIHRVTSSEGSIDIVCNLGTKREVYNFLIAFIAGLNSK